LAVNIEIRAAAGLACALNICRGIAVTDPIGKGGLWMREPNRSIARQLLVNTQSVADHADQGPCPSVCCHNNQQTSGSKGVGCRSLQADRPAKVCIAFAVKAFRADAIDGRVPSVAVVRYAKNRLGEASKGN